MEQKSPGIYILEPLTEAKGLDFEIKSKRTLENNLGPCGEQGTRTPFTPTSTGNLTFVSGLIEKTARYQIRSQQQAAAGKKQIELAFQDQIGLKRCGDELACSAPLKGVKIAGCLHLMSQTACLIETLKELGADIQWKSCKLKMTNDAAYAALAQGNTSIFAWKGQNYQEYCESIKRTLTFGKDSGPDIILDDLGNMTEFIHIGVDIESFYEKNKKLPDLDSLGWVSSTQQSKIAKALGSRRPSAPPEETF